MVTSAYEANAVPVAEYTLSQILLPLKKGWQFVTDVKNNREYPKKPYYHIGGGYGSTVGLIPLSTVVRKVNELLQHFDLNVELCSLMDTFGRADIVSLHTPLLPETIGMIVGKHLKSMKVNASFINTARGAIVKEDELLEVLKQCPDITAILDVTNPAPPIADSLLYELPNAIITPHIAGSEGAECGRMGAYMLEEFKRYQKGEQ